MTTTGEAFEESVQALSRAGVDDPRLDARLIAAFALNRAPEHIFGFPEVELEADEIRLLRTLVARRVAREPLALITGEKEFWSLRFVVTSATLIPRPDSETLIEAVIRTFPDKAAPVKILDLGTGSGCLLLSLLHEYENARGIGTDISEQALIVARTNAKRLELEGRVEFVYANWNDGACNFADFHIILCNPPYIPEGDRDSLQHEVRQYEPHGALFAGPQGLSEYSTIVPLLPDLLKEGGWVFFEVGAGQAETVAEMLRGAGMYSISISPDLAGIGRCVSAKL
ncbi:MAG: peptide chain release factor N(5)-glutamine methyltransferase [Rhodospirillaceae bacterium]|nr:peptide chain release factor N(5)-glutamine methyltransferase [Rhodospirillaceae bacterium]MBL6930611.1 peptide chain release factor N(5)-glutamine methyltransferase [Rhodospirillales bacterium]